MGITQDSLAKSLGEMNEPLQSGFTKKYVQGRHESSRIQKYTVHSTQGTG
jgi:hypothetical protein